MAQGANHGTHRAKREELEKLVEEVTILPRTDTILASVLNPNDFKGWSEQFLCRVKKGKPKQGVGL